MNEAKFSGLREVLSGENEMQAKWSVRWALTSDHSGGLNPGTYGIVRDLLTFVTDFWFGMGALDHICTSEARYTGKDLWDL